MYLVDFVFFGIPWVMIKFVSVDLEIMERLYMFLKILLRIWQFIWAKMKALKPKTKMQAMNPAVDPLCWTLYNPNRYTGTKRTKSAHEAHGFTVFFQGMIMTIEVRQSDNDKSLRSY